MSRPRQRSLSTSAWKRARSSARWAKIRWASLRTGHGTLHRQGPRLALPTESRIYRASGGHRSRRNPEAGMAAHAQQVAAERAANNRKDSPQVRCLPAAVIRLGPLFEFVQSTAMVIEISDDDSPGFHHIYMNGVGIPRNRIRSGTAIQSAAGRETRWSSIASISSKTCGWMGGSPAHGQVARGRALPAARPRSLGGRNHCRRSRRPGQALDLQKSLGPRAKRGDPRVHLQRKQFGPAPPGGQVEGSAL